MAPAAGTRVICTSRRSLLTSSSPTRDQGPPHPFKSPKEQASSPSPWSSDHHNLPCCCQTMERDNWMAWPASWQGWGMSQFVPKSLAHNFPWAGEGSVTFLTCPQPFPLPPKLHYASLYLLLKVFILA
jgi:hypothetical protein